jgi:hypothetical protein
MTTVDVPEWQDAYAAGGIGGLMGAGLSPAGGFGKFLLVLLALSIVANSESHYFRGMMCAEFDGRVCGQISQISTGEYKKWSLLMRILTLLFTK